jgi:nitrite reductase/ring-hydroxylating ferredoxin subunit
LDRLTTTPAGVALCALADLPDPGARNFVLEIGNRRFHGFVVRRGATVTGYVDSCPHMGLPLAKRLDDYLTETGDLIECDWHGALFRPKDGLCVAGPCAGQRLKEWPVEVVTGIVKTRRPGTVPGGDCPPAP